MPTITAGAVATVYCPLASSITITPGDAGRVSFQSRAKDGGQSAAPQEVYSATTVSLSAGDTVTMEAINTDATYTVPSGSVADGTDETPIGRLVRATDSGAILLARPHPNYHCHYFAGDYFADANKISDRSGQENHAVLMSALTGAVAGATAGYISTAAALNQMWEIPDPNIDLFAGDSFFMHWALNHAEITTTATIYGNGASGGSSPGIRMSAVAAASVGTTYQIVWYDAAGNLLGGSTTAAGVNEPAVANTLKTFSMLWNGQTLKWSAWLNGALVRTESAFTVAASTASSSRPRVGGTQSSTTGTAALKTRAMVQMKWGPTETVPATADFTAAIAKLIALPGQLLLDGDL